MDVELLQEYLEPVEVYEKGPPRCRAASNRRREVFEEAVIRPIIAAAGIA